MKKGLSILLIVAMVVSMFAFSASASTVTKNENGNVSIEANYFGGTVDFDYLYGSASTAPSRKTYYDTERVKDGNAANGYLKIDGIIDEGEWGAPVATISSKYAANNISVTGKYIWQLGQTNGLYETPSAENTYYYAINADSNGKYTNAPAEGLEYTVYLMWDEDYLYIACELDDPDGPKQVYSGAQIWDGDCFQVRVDTLGVNSSTEDGIFDASATTKYKDDSGNTHIIYPTPWAGIENSQTGTVRHENIGNFMFSYTSAAGGYTECYDAALRYFPEEETFNDTDENGNVFENTRIKYSGASVADDTIVEAYMDDYCYAVARWDNYGTAKERKDHAVYEIALPWVMLQAEGTEYSPEADDILGFSCALLDGTKLNTPTGQCPDGYVAYLAWGSGICGSQISNDPQTTGGANALRLSSTSYKDVEACDHTFTEATCLAPETCTKCGYQRGYAAGHKYIYSDVVLPTADEPGSILGTCSVCDGQMTGTIEYDGSTCYEAFGTGDRITDTHFGSGFACNWYDDTSSNENRKMLFNEDGTSKTAQDTSTFGYSVVDCATDGTGLYYADGTVATISSDVNYMTQTGTYFDTFKPSSCGAGSNKEFGYSMDVYLTDLTPDPDDGYTDGLFYWFGGESGYKYAAGLFILDDGDTLAFAIADYSLVSSFDKDKYNSMPSELFKSKCLAYKEVNSSVVKENTWSNFTFLYDSDNYFAGLFWDGELQVAVSDYHLEKIGAIEFALFRRFSVPFYAKNIELSSLGYAIEAHNLTTTAGSAETYTVTVDGVETSYEAGATVSLEAAAFKSATAERFAGWTGDTDVLTENKASTTFTMPSKNVVLTSSYIKVGDANGDGKINAADANYIAQIIVGSLASVNAADINADGKVNAGDSNLLTKMITGTYSPVE